MDHFTQQTIRSVNVGRRIRQHRQHMGLTQVELARKAGLSKGHLSAIEREARVPSLAMLEQIAAALDVPVEWLTGRK